MTEEQRETFRKMQAVMSLLEGHGNYVMHTLARDRIRGADEMRRALDRRRAGAHRVFQRAIGLEAKVAQYGLGERFVSQVVERAGPEGFAKVWHRPEHLPTLDEVYRPDRWVDRVAAP
jgi:putative hydrolase